MIIMATITKSMIIWTLMVMKTMTTAWSHNKHLITRHSWGYTCDTCHKQWNETMKQHDVHHATWCTTWCTPCNMRVDVCELGDCEPAWRVLYYIILYCITAWRGDWRWTTLLEGGCRKYIYVHIYIYVSLYIPLGEEVEAQYLQHYILHILLLNILYYIHTFSISSEEQERMSLDPWVAQWYTFYMYVYI